VLNAETTSRMFSFVINPALIPYTYTHTHTHTDEGRSKSHGATPEHWLSVRTTESGSKEGRGVNGE